MAPLFHFWPTPYGCRGRNLTPRVSFLALTSPSCSGLETTPAGESWCAAAIASATWHGSSGASGAQPGTDAPSASVQLVRSLWRLRPSRPGLKTTPAGAGLCAAWYGRPERLRSVEASPPRPRASGRDAAPDRRGAGRGAGAPRGPEGREFPRSGLMTAIRGTRRSELYAVEDTVQL